MNNAKQLDQFYTKPEVAQHCINVVNSLIQTKDIKIFLEPSAGTGSFSSLLKDVIALDLDPKNPSIRLCNFLTTSQALIESFSKREVCTIGNPPFGRRSSLAVKFFNHAATLSDTIAFIVPRTFRKDSIQKQLNGNFWLIHDEDIPKDSFIHQDLTHNVTCCFQVWERRDKIRPKVNVVRSEHLSFSTKRDSDFAVRRVGGRSGNAYLDKDSRAEVSHYFLKNTSNKYSTGELIEIINQIDFQKIANSTAGIRSISRSEFMSALNEALS